MIEKSRILTFPHGFSTRIGGVSEGVYESLNLGMNRGDDKEKVIKNWDIFLSECDIPEREFVCGAQVHKNHVHIAGKEDLRPAYGPCELIEADGYVTNVPGVPIAIFTADCVPVLMEDKKNKVIGAIHCGWRSTVADIEKEAVEAFKKLGSDPKDISIAIGPSIDMCCFEVGGEVITEVCNLLNKDDKSVYMKKTNGKYMLNLRLVVKKRFVSLGVNEEHIEYVGDCTMCNPKKYFSHRFSNGIRGSLASVIEIR